MLCNLLLRRKLCTTAGFLEEKQHAFMHEFTQNLPASQTHLENLQWKSNFKNMNRSSFKEQNHPVMQNFAENQSEDPNRRSNQIKQEMHCSCISFIQVSCKYCSHHHHDTGKLQITDILPEFRTPF